MTRLAKGRDTHLTREEIAAATLRELDAGTEALIGGLAKTLGVAPSAIYHHFDSRAQIVEAAIELVWVEVGAEGYELLPNLFEAEPAEVLVAAALATRRVWFRHHRLVPYMVMTPTSSEFLSASVAVFAKAFERLGLAAADAAPAFHTYATYVLGSVTFGALRLTSDEVLAGERGTEGEGRRFRAAPDARAPVRSSAALRRSMERVIDLSTVDPERDEELFVRGLRRLIAGFTEPGAATR